MPTFLSSMLKYILSLILTVGIKWIFAQKPIIDTNAFINWPSVGLPADISCDGKYAYYTINNKPAGSTTLVIKSTHDKWELHLEAAEVARFTENGELFLFAKGKDSLGIISLEKKQLSYIPHVNSSNVNWLRYSETGMGKWLIYTVKKPNKQLIVRNLETGTEQNFGEVSDYFLNTQENILILQRKIEKDNGLELHWVDLVKDTNMVIWKGSQASNIIFDNSGTQVVFITRSEENTNTGGVIWRFKAGMKIAEILVDSSKLDYNGNLNISNVIGFSRDGNRLFFKLKKGDAAKTPMPNAAKVDVWSYRDPKLQSQQLKEISYPSTYTYSLNIPDSRVIRLENENEKIISHLGESDDKFILISQRGEGDIGNEWNWNKTAIMSIYLISTIDGSRKKITAQCPPPLIYSYSISPGGKYIVYYNATEKNYFSYEIPSGITRNITQAIQTKWTTYHRNDEPLAPYELMGQVGWLKDDRAVLLYDQNDIFEVDPTKKSSPINLTNGYGFRHGIQFRLAISHPAPFELNEFCLLSSFSRVTKDDGFFSVVLDKREDPKLLNMQPYIFKGSVESDDIETVPPIKARKTETYLVRRMSAEESPNYFITNDFKTYNPISSVYPEKKYTWLTSQLITWKTPDGITSQGILYKPENFDKKKKYPVIFHYYEKLSEGLHGFMKPELENGIINIPFYVSNGYILFVPDIHYTIGQPGKSACNTIESAAKYLSRFPWVDSRKMGIQGHSFGGYQTNYLITHTKLFSAACSASGWANFVSAYNAIREGADGVGRRYFYEMYRERMGGTLWNQQNQYIESSPVFKADKVTTPILMMNNQKDKDVSFFYGVEFFNALRRLGKKAWMLQYDGEGHVVFDETAQMDFHIRMKQFFDHYLKDAPAPKWMIEGIPARMKGIDQGYELEPAGLTPGNGLLK